MTVAIPDLPPQGDTNWYLHYSALDAAMRELQDAGPGADGRGIVSIVRTSGDGSAGTVDTYTVSYTDSTTSTFTVTNGAAGPAALVYIADSAAQATKDALIADPANEGKMYLEYTP